MMKSSLFLGVPASHEKRQPFVGVSATRQKSAD